MFVLVCVCVRNLCVCVCVCDLEKELRISHEECTALREALEFWLEEVMNVCVSVSVYVYVMNVCMCVRESKFECE